MMRFGAWCLASAASAALLLGGCQSEKPAPAASETAADTVDTASETATEPAADASEVAVGGGRTEKVENDTYEFSYAYPDAAGAIPGLKANLDKQLETSRADLISGAKEGQAESKENDYPYHAYSYGEEWKVVTDLPNWLSLSSEIYTYSGGAHGMTMFDALLWDRHAEAVRKPIDLFTSKEALSKAIRTAFCTALDKERVKRRGGPIDKSDEMFSECIDPVEQVVILGSTNRQTFDRIGLLVPPYNAGPYAEGSYEVTVPVTGAVMAALKPQYRSSFSVAR
ncbi:DUF4163 domain-containing protein [Novosphingobium lindaniclasticum]|uniref:Deacetylase PdaC domain-containing protein n=1 Tax=Novosphingobium lindaniclasticum LE124 TaxID=1096930 RepID=T0HWK9_9SPHN|nr:DUF4163 domain-containing protein [Novosphingobium lindaniclasticum]EQB17462.1 hypothetical protein L284_07825 [Novosphingobium lindaniclasticum LE124]